MRDTLTRMRIAARRILVIGTSCAGKTTFAAALARRLNLPHVELDALHWGPNWTPRDDFVPQVQRAAATDAWVMDGNYKAVRHLTWSRAELIVWLDYEMGVVVGRALRRTIRRAWTQEMLWSTNRESWRLSFLSRESILVWVLSTWRKRRLGYRKAFSKGGEFSEKPLIRLGDPAATDALLDGLTA